MHVKREIAVRFFIASAVLTVACTPKPSTADTGRYDVVVLGATPGGIAAAVAAGRAGRSVLLVSYHRHVGGMMTSGLGKSDIEHRAMIGGLFREFVERVYTHYVGVYGHRHEHVVKCRDGYYYEPSVAEEVLTAMLEEQPTIAVLKNWRLESTGSEEGRLTNVQIVERESGEVRTVSGLVFIDATYEGDLYAAAGAQFRLGREARSEFDEPHAGVIYVDYRDKRILPGSTGAADDALPAYTYRLCLTSDPDNAFPLTEPPPGYDRGRYLGYFDDLKAGRLDAPKSFKPGRGYNPKHFGTLVRALSVTEIPNRKYDVNINPRPLGFPFPELNRGYVEGDEVQRGRIRRDHRNLALGLLWFLQHDPQVPEAHRRLAAELHLPRDEFVDNGHFPFQLYVREARRLVGEYTLTEHDITGDGSDKTPRSHSDSIAVGEFPIDSFPCRLRQPGDAVVLEGYLGMLDHITRPYEIPYRIMTPKRIDGLIVPVAASTTHVGFSSIRMEPTWMALGQAAGTAADLAVELGVRPRDVPIPTLQERLLRQGQVLRHVASQPPDPVANPQASLMLDGDWVPENTHDIQFDELPRVRADHVVVSDVRRTDGVNQHNYLVRFADRFWLMWSDGPGVEDQVGQRVKFATSVDGLQWTEAQYLTPSPPNSGPSSPHYGTRSEHGLRWISRGFWVRDGQLLALASLDEAGKFFGPALKLHAFAWHESESVWRDLGVIVVDAINNFPPRRLPGGPWMMSRRTHDYKRTGVQFLVGGDERIDSWRSAPVLGSSSALSAEEPFWWSLPGSHLMALFRDNRRSGYLYRSFSTDKGQTWSPPVRTNFPDATSKMYGLRMSDGRYVLVSNANPLRRDPLVISVSDDGMVFNQMAYLFGGRRVDYPHAIEHNGSLLVAFSGGKQSVELLKFPITELERVAQQR